MEGTEISRIILGLRAIGLSGDEINDFMIYIATGDKEYLPKENKNA